MTRRDILRGFGVTAAALLTTSCAFLRSWTYRYRLTVAMSAAGKEYTGSGVIEVKRQKGLNVIGADVKGEAVVIDLGRAGKAFATLVSSRGGQGWPGFVAHKAFAGQLGTSDTVDEGALDKMPSLIGSRAELNTHDYPMIVRFKDINDPTSVEVIDPSDIMAGSGPNIEIRRVLIEMTSAPVTYGIEKALPWYRFDGKLSREKGLHPGSPEKDLIKSAFQQGVQ